MHGVKRRYFTELNCLLSPPPPNQPQQVIRTHLRAGDGGVKGCGRLRHQRGILARQRVARLDGILLRPGGSGDRTNAHQVQQFKKAATMRRQPTGNQGVTALRSRAPSSLPIPAHQVEIDAVQVLMNGTLHLHSQPGAPSGAVGVHGGGVGAPSVQHDSCACGVRGAHQGWVLVPGHRGQLAPVKPAEAERGARCRPHKLQGCSSLLAHRS